MVDQPLQPASFAACLDRRSHRTLLWTRLHGLYQILVGLVSRLVFPSHSAVHPVAPRRWAFTFLAIELEQSLRQPAELLGHEPLCVYRHAGRRRNISSAARTYRLAMASPRQSIGIDHQDQGPTSTAKFRVRIAIEVFRCMKTKGS